MIRLCRPEESHLIEEIINTAAAKYRGVIPEDCWHDPYMGRTELSNEIAQGVEFWGWEETGLLIAVMGVQDVKDVTLIRHAYVLPEYQGRGIGSLLLEHLAKLAKQPLLVGTWADSKWALRFYEAHGFRLVDSLEADRLLRTYWRIPDRRRQASVVLAQSLGAE